MQKAAIFIDNSNIFKGVQQYTRQLVRKEQISKDQYLRVNWKNVIKMLESQEGGIDIFARHFFASLPPAADVSKLRRPPTQEEWDEIVKKSAQTGFYKFIQEPPLNFTLHGIPLRFSQVKCRNGMRTAYYKCLNAYDGTIGCNLKLNPDECYKCQKDFLYKYEKGVDVALASELVIFGGEKAKNLDRIILIAGDGNYKEAIKYIRTEVGKDVQILSWQIAFSKELGKIANKPTIFFENHLKELCETRRKPPLDEMPGSDEDINEERSENTDT